MYVSMYVCVYLGANVYEYAYVSIGVYVCVWLGAYCMYE